MRARRSRPDRATIENLEVVLRLAGELRRTYLDIVDIAEDVPITGGVGGSIASGGTHSDPTARHALDGRRQARRHAIKQVRKQVSAALDAMQRASFHAGRAQSDSPGLWGRDTD
jgi:hypothetical protein